MKNRLFLFLLTSILILLGCQSPSVQQVSGIKLLEHHHQPKTDSELFIPYSKYQLDNGLTVILHEDHSDPLVNVSVAYHVGSSREVPGMTGFAHFFEHMMFQGSKHVDDEEHFKIINRIGGSANGSTSYDYTDYYQTVPANHLEKVLWLESDRMGFLLDAVDQEKFEIQRDTVKNERNQRVDSRPYGLITEKIGQALYPEDHPYSWQPIGYVEDLNRVDVDVLKAFFDRWYGPNNAILAIGGDINPEQTLAWIKKYFAEIPRGPEVKRLEKRPVKLKETRYVAYEDNISTPLLYITYPTVHSLHKDKAALNVLANILGNGKTSLFYQKLIDEGLSVQAGANHGCNELACSFALYALPSKNFGFDLNQINQSIKQILLEFEERGVTEADIEKTVTYLEASSIMQLESVDGRISVLIDDEIFTGDAAWSEQDLDRYRQITPNDVIRVYNQYIKNQHAVVLSVVPEGKQEWEIQGKPYEYPGRTLELNIESLTSKNLRQTPITFDRSKIPVSPRHQGVEPPAFWQSQLENKILVSGIQNTEIPMTELLISLEGGPLLDSPGKAGIAQITAQMMNEATEFSSTEEIADTLERLGSEIYFSTAGRYFNISLSSLSRNLDPTLTLLAEKLFYPKFEQATFNRIKQQVLQRLEHQLTDINSQAELAKKLILYGTHSRQGVPDSGIISTVQNITLEDIKSYYQHYINSAQASILIAGDRSQQSYLKSLEFLKTWQKTPYIVPGTSRSPYREQTLYLIDEPGAVQSAIRIVKHSSPYDATGEHFRANLMNYPFGGFFNSRLNLFLREEKGYTYGASSHFSGGKTLGIFEFSTQVKQEYTEASIRGFFDLLDEWLDTGMSDEELQTIRQSYIESDALNYETLSQKALFLRQLLNFNLPINYVEIQNNIINQINKKELNKLARKLLQPDSFHIIVVGDAKKIRSQLESLPYKIQDLELNRL